MCACVCVCERAHLFAENCLPCARATVNKSHHTWVNTKFTYSICRQIKKKRRKIARISIQLATFLCASHRGVPHFCFVLLLSLLFANQLNEKFYASAFCCCLACGAKKKESRSLMRIIHIDPSKRKITLVYINYSLRHTVHAKHIETNECEGKWQKDSTVSYIKRIWSVCLNEQRNGREGGTFRAYLQAHTENGWLICV